MILPAALILSLAACSSVRETQPDHTATEQLLFSTAADRAAAKLSLTVPDGAKVFVDGNATDGSMQAKYLLSAIRDQVLRRGGRLVDDKGQADMAVEPRIGAMSVDRNTTLYGIPDYGIPIPLAGEVKTPELALYKRDIQQGVIKLAVTSYDPKTGALIQAADPVYGFAHTTERALLFFIYWTRNDLAPDAAADGWVNRV
ncbi:DUF6655 family protein [Ferrovibrio sp.]|uniref:DUF6655 family protein n=1 Tax=Ferrovibrio sp. TaxID=1917215 RepID=UPI0035158E9A